MIGEPLSLFGAVHESNSDESCGVAVTDVGAFGERAGVPKPIANVPTVAPATPATRTRYEVPFVSGVPVNVSVAVVESEVSCAADQVTPPFAEYDAANFVTLMPLCAAPGVQLIVNEPSRGCTELIVGGFAAPVATKLVATE